MTLKRPVTYKQLNEVHQMVWDFRKRHGEYFATPTPEWCVMYALEEIGEAIAILTRLERPGDARNREISVTSQDYAKELTDVLMMMLSVFDNIPASERDYLDFHNEAMKNPDYDFYLALIEAIYNTLRFIKQNVYYKNYAIRACVLLMNEIYAVSGEEPSMYLETKLGRIYEKRVKPQL